LERFHKGDGSVVRTRFGQFTLDSDTRQLFRDREEIHVSPKAFELLCALIARRPGVVAKQELFGRIWPNTFVAEANLNVLVGELRRALADDARAPRWIRTAHGVGYAFCADATEVEGAEPSRAAQAARFWLEAGDRTYPLGLGEHIIGRDPRSGVWLNDSSVSRRHARIRITGDPGTAMLEDLDSTNGTFVGRHRIGTPTALADGHRIKVGSVELTFREGAGRLAATRRVRRGTR
jgi:DNA-binding winged helix-turn-helix (wHTH) protein